MLTQNSLNTGARWSVMWLGKQGIVEKKYGDDFAGAIATYFTLKQAGKKVVTLRSCNVGFKPPAHILEYEEVSYKVVTHKGKKYKKKTVTVVNLMERYNLEGKWWCPYCICLRPFKRKSDRSGRVIMACPVCNINNYDWHVRRWNPQAKTIEYRRTRGRRTKQRAGRTRSNLRGRTRKR